MLNEYLWCGRTLISFLPSDWNKVVFSLFVRECEINNKKAFSKEFQCKCLTNSVNEILDLVKYYENDFLVEDKMFMILDFLYKKYKEDPSCNFLIFSLENSGKYELERIKIDSNNVNIKSLTNIVNNYLMKNI